MVINEALKTARLAHKGQIRKGGKIPYILHPMEAGVIAASLSTKNKQVDEEVVAAAILHDVIEDTDLTYQDLSKDFSDRVLELVRLQSEDKSKSWQERKEWTIESLENNEDMAFEIVTLADKLSNLRSIERDYQTQGDDLWERFNVKEKSKHKWYYSSIIENIKHLKDTREYKEYKDLLELFN
ncbi:MAG TPA: bifunctional (p)ppGpp synthetase/guanosine-3',5'-bis(diphosphate) 3'-pyrophosphohydrolase [Epulopiscium sp.]|nr:bifunctional (p)ppGpp synthetase/guanosine-3',5'-bis(diphosphate) 3'-pyrophosphohydrolase [Candidatus Epulonipiscium sp.]